MAFNPIWKATEGVAFAAAIDPQLVDNSAVTSDWVDMRLFKQCIFIVSVGATDITVDAKVQSADDTSGTNNTDIASLSVTQLTASDDNKQVILLVTSDDLNTDDVAAAVVVTVGDGTTGAYVSAIGIGFNARTLPATDNDVASVAEIVSL